jgi:hypothetical protein
MQDGRTDRVLVIRFRGRLGEVLRGQLAGEVDPPPPSPREAQARRAGEAVLKAGRQDRPRIVETAGVPNGVSATARTGALGAEQ